MNEDKGNSAPSAAVSGGEYESSESTGGEPAISAADLAGGKASRSGGGYLKSGPALLTKRGRAQSMAHIFWWTAGTARELK